jgi:hypothetical protein
VVIFARSEKDADKPPKAGGVKKDGTPSKLQPLTDNPEPMSKFFYMTYLPTVTFGPGMTSATEIRTAWPQLNNKRKTALVMSLYPKTQANPKLANTVVKMLDTAIVTDVTEGFGASTPAGEKILNWQNTKLNGNQFGISGYTVKFTPDALLIYKGPDVVYKKSGDYSQPTNQHLVKARRMITLLLQGWKQGVDENQGWAATLEAKNKPGVVAQKFDKDPALRQIMLFAKQHYPQYANDPEQAMLKWLQRSLLHSKQEDTVHNQELTRLASKVQDLERKIDQIRPNPNYMDEAGRKY